VSSFFSWTRPLNPMMPDKIFANHFFGPKFNIFLRLDLRKLGLMETFWPHNVTM